VTKSFRRVVKSSSKLWRQSAALRTGLIITRFQDASTATIFVGPQRSAFVAHIDLLCENLEYFQAALLGQFAESTKEVALTDQDADSFEYFVQWLYKRSLKDAQLTTDTVSPKVAVKWATVTEVYVLAQYLQAPKLCNKLLDMIRSHMRPSPLSYRHSFALPESHAVNLVYSKTPHDSNLRKLIVSVFLREKDEGMWNDAQERKDWLRKLPVDFCHDLLIATSRYG
jgi:BTB/POZ domain